MRSSITIVSFFIAGVVLGRTAPAIVGAIAERSAAALLCMLMACVGFTAGGGGEAAGRLKSLGARVLWLPACTITGTFAGAAAISFLLPGRSLCEVLMVGSGFGYYSLSSLLIAKAAGPALATVGMISNVLREVFTLIFAPLMARYFSPIAPICSGGATTADTTLPAIQRFSGAEYTFIALVHGVIVDFSVPLFVTFFASL